MTTHITSLTYKFNVLRHIKILFLTIMVVFLPFVVSLPASAASVTAQPRYSGGSPFDFSQTNLNISSINDNLGIRTIVASINNSATGSVTAGVFDNLVLNYQTPIAATKGMSGYVTITLNTTRSYFNNNTVLGQMPASYGVLNCPYTTNSNYYISDCSITNSSSFSTRNSGIDSGSRDTNLYTSTMRFKVNFTNDYRTSSLSLNGYWAYLINNVGTSNNAQVELVFTLGAVTFDDDGGPDSGVVEGLENIDSTLQQNQQAQEDRWKQEDEQKKQEEQNAQDIIDGSTDSADAAQDDLNNSTSNFVTIMGDFVNALTNSSASNCRVRANLGNLDLGNLDFCTGKPSEFNGLFTTVIVLILAPVGFIWAKHIFADIVSLLESFTGYPMGDFD